MLPLPRRSFVSAVLAAVLLAGSASAELTFTGRDPATFADVAATAVSSDITGSNDNNGGGNSESTTTNETPVTSAPAKTPEPSTSAPKTSAPKPSSAPSKPKSTAWRMKTVTSIQARVQGDQPYWDEEHGVYVSKFGSTFAEKHRGALDTVNMASVEGALMYVQAEGINVKEQDVKCERKNNMQYVVFYEFQIAQTVNSIAKYQSVAPTKEYCPFVAMDGGSCTATEGKKLPKECNEFNGLEGQPNLGPCVGSELKDSDFRAPYPNNYWFSFPNSCPSTPRANKTDACRAEQPGGLCPFGKSPDGLACTFAYKVLGYIRLDDLVGITSITRKSTGNKYANLKEFCEDGGIEFEATQDTKTLTVKRTLPFWKDPTNPKANQARFQKMVTLYNKMVKASGGKMTALPSVAQLQKVNPPCYENNVECAKASSGCKRVNYYQACEVCTSSGDAACAVAPSGFSFPQLAIDENFKLDPSGDGGDGAFLNATSSSASGFGEEEIEPLSDGSDLTMEESTTLESTTPTPSPTKKASSATSLRVVASSMAMGLVVAAAAIF